MWYTIKAQHFNGESVSHSCNDGIYCDPVDQIDGLEVFAERETRAVLQAYDQLGIIARNMIPCKCQRHWQPGSKDWCSSVCLWVEQSDAPERADHEKA